MKKIILIINLILIPCIFLYASDPGNRIVKSKYKIVRTHFRNLQTNVLFSTLSQYDAGGRLIYYKSEYPEKPVKDVYEYRYVYNPNIISLTNYENGIKAEEVLITLDDAGNFLVYKTVYSMHKNYKNRKYLYKDNRLAFIIHTDPADSSGYLKEEFFYDNRNVTKVICSGNDYKGLVKLFEYNGKDKIVKETWLSENNTVRVIKYNYNQQMVPVSKITDVTSAYSIITSRDEYFYNNNGDLVKELSYVQDRPYSEKVYQYE